jgi:hypothetical protein
LNFKLMIMALPSYYKYWQPPTELNFNTDIMSGYNKLNSLGIGLSSNQPSLPTKSGLGSALGIAGGMAGGLMDLYEGINADTSEIDNAVDRQVDALGNIKYGKASSLDELMSNQSAFRGLEADHTGDEFYQGPSTGGIFADALAKGASAAMSASSTTPIGMAIAGVGTFASSLAGQLLGRSKKQKAAGLGASSLNAEEIKKNNYMAAAFRNDANNLNTLNNRSLMSQMGIKGAYGGPLGVSLTPVNGAIDFMQNEELLSSLGEDITKNNNRRTSMPMFAFGGALGGYGGDWSNGLTYIGAGGSHEENPLGGVIVGMSEDGRPDQVEEGEYIWKDQDYVFSKRIEIPEEEYEALGLKKGKRKLTYADGAEILQKESAERPNDPISEKGKNVALMKLMQSQEQQRALLAQQEQQEQIEYAMGGGLSRDKDYGSKKKPYPKVKDKDFAGGGRSYPIPTKADAIDALRLAGLHGRSDVKAKVYKKYPELKKALGGHLFDDGGLSDSKKMFYHDYTPLLGEDTTFNPGGVPYMLNFFAPKPLTSLYPNNSMFKTSSNFGLGYAPLTADLSANYSNTGITSTENSSNISSVTGTGVTNGASTERDPLPTSGWQTSLRYLPAIAPAISLGYSLLKKPDYGYADELDAAGNAYAEAVREGGKVTPKFIGDYLAYNPFDRIFYANELGAQQAANRGAIMNAGNANRGATMAALLGSGYNDNIGLGKLFREGDEYNLAQRQKVAEFNRGTNQYNSTLDMQAQEINARENERLAAALLGNKYKSLAMKQAIDNQRDQSISLALTNLFNNLGDIGWEAKQGYWNNALINSGYYGTPNASMYDIAYGANGGKLKRKKKKGLTI